MFLNTSLLSLLHFLKSLICKPINIERSRFIRYTRPSTSPSIAILFVRSSMLTLTSGFWLEVDNCSGLLLRLGA